MSSRTFTLRHCPVPAAHAVELRVCNIIDRVSNSAPVCTKETDDTPSLWSISGTQGIPHLCPRRSKSPRSQTLVLLWTRRCVCVESPGPTGLVLLASTSTRLCSCAVAGCTNLRGKQKISLNAALSGSAGLAIVAHCKHSKRKKHHVSDGSMLSKKWDFLAAAAAG